MKKALALILALLMLCSTVVVTSVAADPVAIDIEDMPGYEKAYIGAPIAVAPVQDGTINEGEYTFSRKLYPITPNKAGGADMSKYTNPLSEYWAYDADFIYYAFVSQAAYDHATQLTFRLTHDYIIGATPNVFSSHRPLSDADALTITINKGDSQFVIGSAPTGKSAPVAGDDFDAFNNFTQSYAPACVEVKLSRAYLATQMGLGSASEVTKFTYSTRYNDTKYDGSNWTYAFLDHVLTAGQAAWLTAQGVTVDTGFVSESASSLSRVCNMIVLGEKPVEENYWESVVTDLGLAVDVKPVTKTPTLDGVISADEYPTKVITPTASIYGAGTAEVDSENIVEYYGHDAEYIYYAAVYDRDVSGRAFWPRFKLENTCNIYTPDTSHNKWQLSVQARLTAGNDAYLNENAAYADHVAPVFEQEIFVEGSRVGNTETYEFKISKEYIARENPANNVTADDIKYIPYLTWFHNAATLGTNITSDIATAITNAGGTAPATGEVSYKFMVLSGETTKVEDRIEITTSEKASVRISAVAPGLRFKSTVNKADLLTLVTKFGAENVKVGTLIAPDAQDLELTINTASKLDVAATVASPFGTDGANTIFAGSISNVKTANLERDFAARGYIAYNDGTGWNYIYSDVTAVRDITEVVNAALADDEAGYTQAQIDVLNAIIAPLN